jgi:peptide/nickel transport system permease protein
VTLRRYLLVRTAWAAGVVFAFVSIAYVVVWVVGDYRRDPGYGGFLSGVLRGDLGQTSFPGPGKRVSVNSVVWPASKVTLSLLLVTAVFTLVLAVLLALLARRGRVALASVRGFEFLGVSLLPIWTALLIGVYLFGKGHLLHAGGYCPLGSARAGQCHGPVEWAAHLVWPALTLAVFYAAVYSRMLRHDLRQAERERRARVADGEAAELVRRDVRRYYGAVYAKRAGRDLGFGLGFAFFAEVAFGLPGLGTTVYVARFGDPALMAGVLVWATVLGAAAGLLADALVAVLDPRFRRF